MPASPAPDAIHLRAGGVSVVLDTAGDALPRLLHRGWRSEQALLLELRAA